MGKIYIILAVDSRFGIAKNKRIPWKITEDMHFFYDTTNLHKPNSKNAVIMGKNTYLVTGILSGRDNIIISSTLGSIKGELTAFTKISEALTFCCNGNYENIFVCGGKSVYEKMMRDFGYLIDGIYLTSINKNYECDVLVDLGIINKLISNLDLVNSVSINLIDKFDNTMVTCTFNYYDRNVKLNIKEFEYLETIQEIITLGHERQTRNSIVKSIFGKSLTFDLNNGFPLLTSKRIFFRGVFEELMFFLRGDTNTKHLSEKNVNIWKPNTSREFLDSVGLQYEEGDMGPCFLSDTWVFTADGHKNISELENGESVCTHNGVFKKINKTFKRQYTGEIYSILHNGSPDIPIECTPEHPFLVKNIENQKISYIPARDLRPHIHKLGIILNTNNVIPTLEKYCYKSPEMWNALGLYAMCGYINKGIINFILYDNVSLSSMSKLYGTFPYIESYKRDAGKTYYKVVNSTIPNVCQLFGQLGTNMYKKIPQFIFDAPVNLLREFIDGYTQNLQGDNTLLFTTLENAYDFQLLFAKIGRKSVLQRIQHMYLLTLCNTADAIDISGNCLWCDIITMTIRSVSDRVVFNISVEDDHTYTANNIVVHNCYGFQWRHFNAEYFGCNANYDNKGFDQLNYCINLLKNDPFSRRIMMTSYNPIQASQGVLFPCHGNIILFYVDENFHLSCMMTQRSADYICGVPFNIASYALLVTLLCELINNDSTYQGRRFTPGKIILNFGDVHIYNDHMEAAVRQLLRIPTRFPTISFNRKITSINDIEFKDVEINNYFSHPALNVKMIP